jgi:hypothetical protein
MWVAHQAGVASVGVRPDARLHRVAQPCGQKMLEGLLPRVDESAFPAGVECCLELPSGFLARFRVEHLPLARVELQGCAPAPVRPLVDRAFAVATLPIHDFFLLVAGRSCDPDVGLVVTM